LLGGGRQTPPGVFAIDAIDKVFQRAVDVATPDLVDGNEHARAPWGWPAAYRGRIERGIEIAAGLGQHQLAQQIRPLLRNAEGDMPAAGMAQKIDRLGVNLL